MKSDGLKRELMAYAEMEKGKKWGLKIVGVDKELLEDLDSEYDIECEWIGKFSPDEFLDAIDALLKIANDHEVYSMDYCLETWDNEGGQIMPVLNVVVCPSSTGNIDTSFVIAVLNMMRGRKCVKED